MISVYAATAFVILELTDIVAPSLSLPPWTLNFVIIILSIGFIIAVVVSWIYDFHPLGGIVRTKPAEKRSTSEMPRFSNSWKIASYISFVVILGLVVLNIFTRAKRTEPGPDPETSIAVLPFENMSEDASYSHMGGAFTDEIIMELQKIKGFNRVVSRTSTMQFERDMPTIPEIAEILNVNYIMTGSIQRLERRVRIRVQVTAKNEDHIWGDTFDKDYVKPEDILDIQSSIAQSVADELKVRITPEEIKLIESVPTTNLTAYDFYQRGKEAYWHSQQSRVYSESLTQATEYFEEALKHDSRFALAYAGLAMVQYSKFYTNSPSGGQYSTDYYESGNLDSMYMLAEKALLYDDQLADAYFAKAMYLYEKGNSKQGLELLRKTFDLNPNHILALLGAAEISLSLNNYVDALVYLHKAESLEKGMLLPVIYSNLFQAYIFSTGDWELSSRYLDKYLAVTGDSITYFQFKYLGEFQYGNQREAFKYAEAAYAVDSTYDEAIMYLGKAHYDAGRYQKAYIYYHRYYHQLEEEGILDINDMNRMGHILWMLGKKDSARIYFSSMIEHCHKHIEINSSGYGRNFAFFDLAGVYAFLGEQDSAFYYLESLKGDNKYNAYILDYLTNLDPLFVSIRSEVQFQELCRQLNTKYQAEHERVRQWLEENDKL